MGSAKSKKTTSSSKAWIIWVSVGVFIALMFVGVFLTKKAETQNQAGAVPTNSTTAGAITVGNGPVTVDIYEDFQCPSCAKFEGAYGNTLSQMVAAGKIKANYYSLSFLGPESERAAAAGACASNENKFSEFHAYLYANQPTEKTGGYTTNDLISAGQAVGLGEQFATCVTDGTYATWITNANKTAQEVGITGTPSFAINGKTYNNDGKDQNYFNTVMTDIEKAIAASPSATPSVSSSVPAEK